jgi:hypothetical protein
MISGTRSVVVVDENTVTDLAMFAERFAVIGGNNDDRVVSNWTPVPQSSGRPVYPLP